MVNLELWKAGTEREYLFTAENAKGAQAFPFPVFLSSRLKIQAF
jgi:hypothetical protein